MKRIIITVLLINILGVISHKVKSQSVFHYTVNYELNMYKTELFDFTTQRPITSGSEFTFGLAYERALTQNTSIKLGMTFSVYEHNIVDRYSFNDPNNVNIDIGSERAIQFDWGHRFYFNNPQYLQEGMYGPYIGTNLAYKIMNVNLDWSNIIKTNPTPSNLTFLRPSFRIGYQIPTFFELDLFAQINYNIPLNGLEIIGITNDNNFYQEKFTILNPISYVLGASLIYGW